MPKEVVIDGVRYVPAAYAVANGPAVLRALVATWWGPKPDAERVEEARGYLRVLVTDDASVGEPIDDFMATLAQELDAQNYSEEK